MNYIKQSKLKAQQTIINFTIENTNELNAINRIDKFCSNNYLIIANNFDDYCNHEKRSPERVNKILFFRFVSILMVIRGIISVIYPDNKNITNMMSNPNYLFGNSQIITIVLVVIMITIFVSFGIYHYFETKCAFYH